jgi:hypothetical protein
LELERLDFESFELEHPLAHNHNPKHSFLNNHFAFLGMMLERPLELEHVKPESIEL